MCSICLQGRVKQSDKGRYRGKIQKHNSNTKRTTYSTRYPPDVINSVLIQQKKKKSVNLKTKQLTLTKTKYRKERILK